MTSCNDPEMAKLIAAYELGLLPDERRAAFEAHLMECGACFEELAQMEPVTTLVRQRRLAPEAELDLAVDRDSTSRRLQRRWPFLLAAVAAAAVAGILVLRPPEPVLRGGVESPVILYAPAGETPVPERLDWKVVPGSVAYELSIYTDEGQLIWNGSADEPPCELPVPAREALRPGQRYSWEVEAVAPDGTRQRSDPSWFTIAR